VEKMHAVSRVLFIFLDQLATASSSLNNLQFIKLNNFSLMNYKLQGHTKRVKFLKQHYYKCVHLDLSAYAQITNILHTLPQRWVCNHETCDEVLYIIMQRQNCMGFPYQNQASAVPQRVEFSGG